jgi:hypothetical protein
MMGLHGPDKIVHFPAVFEFIRAMRALGADLDPEDGFLRFSLFSARTTLPGGLNNSVGQQVADRLADQGMAFPEYRPPSDA